MSLTIVSHFQLVERHLIEWFPVSAAYSFAQSGAGDYSIEPSGHFTYIDAEGTPKDLYATVEGIAKIKLSDNLSASRAVHDKRLNWKMRSKPKFENCSPQRQRILELSIVAAKNTATKAYRAARRIKGPSAQYTTWFGTYDTKRKKTVVATFRKMKNYISKLTYECGCGEDEDYNHSGLSACKHTFYCKAVIRSLISLSISPHGRQTQATAQKHANAGL